MKGASNVAQRFSRRMNVWASYWRTCSGSFKGTVSQCSAPSLHVMPNGTGEGCAITGCGISGRAAKNVAHVIVAILFMIESMLHRLWVETSACDNTCMLRAGLDEFSM